MSSSKQFGPTHRWLRAIVAFLTIGAAPLAGPEALQGQTCNNTVTADVVAFDQFFWYNRLGAHVPHGMIYALRRDVVNATTGLSESEGGVLEAGNVMLRPDKRPRPLTLRVNVGDCLAVNFQNLLGATRPWVDQPNTRAASYRVIGMQLVGGIMSDGSNVGKNSSSLVDPNGTATYTLYAEREGTYFAYSGGAQTGGEGDGGSLAFGLFGAVNVEPGQSEWYRSQLTNEEMALATVQIPNPAYIDPVATPNEPEMIPATTAGGQPVLDYDAVYPASHPRAGGATDVPIVNIVNAAGEIVHSDLAAVITGPNRGWINSGGGACDQWYPENPILRDRCQPFREFTIIFHDEIKAIQFANDLYVDPVLGHTLHSVRDGFAINYGTGGIGSEILANRMGLGPMADCNECKYEEFFLASWAVGDPAMVVDVPASLADPANGVIATKALYPDDPSNTYHSYLNDHVKIRNLHAGPKEHHIFHLHAHQWVNTPDSEKSSYLDSQAIGPGAGYTYDITYDGSGNRPKSVGDAIFHCHFYPHFAQGMWALWRVHDSFERGTLLDQNGIPVAGPDWYVRALPDGEIQAGTATPAVVPLPGKAMAPMPTADLPGFPYYIPGVPGHRPPQPPLDFAPNTDASSDLNGNGLIDGGLPRHVVHGGEAHAPALNRLDFSKENLTLDAEELPHEGTVLEQNAMAFHETQLHPSFVQPANGDLSAAAAGWFETNGLPPVAGAPFADPCRDDYGVAVGSPLLYKGAAFQIDAAYTKTGWHYPQHRMLGLNADVGAVMSGEKPAEPFFFRANTNHCISYWLTNLLPKDYAMDDFQVLTPTDVMGQHIHLVKFDVTASDGAANGYNYEDGSLSPEEVVERIAAINAVGGLSTPGGRIALQAEPHPYFKDVAPVKNATIGGRQLGDATYGLALGAQSTVQRWFADDTKDSDGDDRTLRTVFTHDHFAPSTQQQAGYYAGLVVEPEGSVWRDNETGEVFGPPEVGSVTPADAGYAVAASEQAVTSWQAIIDMTGAADPSKQGDSYREFMFEYQDMQLAYTAQSDNTFKQAEHAGVVTEGIFDVTAAINPPAKKEIGLPLLTQVAPACPGGVPRPCPEAISADDPGIMTVNYRAEPVALRVLDPNALPDANGGLQQAAGTAGDLSYAFKSGEQTADGLVPVTRAVPELNYAPGQWPYLSLGDTPGRAFATGPLQAGAETGDPITPLLRAYESDNVQVRQLVGAHEEGHNFNLHGVKWLFEPSWGNSGYRSSQMAGISEHFEFRLSPSQPVKGPLSFEDYLYQAGAAADDLWAGSWGIMRMYSGLTPDLAPLPNNPDGKSPLNVNPGEFQGVCPRTPDPNRPGRFLNPNQDPFRKTFSIVAVRAADVLPDEMLVYNSRASNGGPLYDPNAIIYVRSNDIASSGPNRGKLKDGIAVEPLVLRVNAGDCVGVTLENRLPAELPDQDGFSTLPLVVANFNTNELTPSSHVGLHAQLLSYDMFESDGANVGWNPVQTAGPGETVVYRWYAGESTVCINGGPIPGCEGKEDGTRAAYPMEYGAIPLMSSDRIKHAQKGAIGALVVEPQGATWVEDGFGVDNKDREACLTPPCRRTSATVTLMDGTAFRDFVLLFQDDVNLVKGDGTAVENLADSEDPEDSGQKAFNYKTEPMWLRLGYAPDAPLTSTRDVIYTDALSNTQVGGDPETPVFTAEVGTPVRFRVVQSGGHARNHVFALHGHVWQQLPYTCNSSDIGNNKKVTGVDGCADPNARWITEFKGAQEGMGPTNYMNVMPQNGAGGIDGVTGDYLIRDFASFQFDGGLWGILRVCATNEGGNEGNTACSFQ